MKYVSSKLTELKYTIAFSKYFSTSLLSIDFCTVLVSLLKVQNYLKNFYGSY